MPTARWRACRSKKQGEMILGAVSYLDCLVFCIFLAPQLLWQVGFFETLSCVLQTLPFLMIKLPLALIRERYIIGREKRSAFVQRASPFEDLVVRCVRYAFANIPPRIGRVFFVKEVALPFLWFRWLRHGYLGSPIFWREHRESSFRGIWIIKDPTNKPDVVLYYAHGGGFSMGSAYFYLEYLLTWLSVLSSSGYRNPAIFALEYTLVPDASFPVQVDEAMKAYEHVLTVAVDPSTVCVSGDSAGATLILCLLLRLGADNVNGRSAIADRRQHQPARPGLAVLISPWVTLLSERHRNTVSDYLDVQQLHQYGELFAGRRISSSDPSVSPGCCEDTAWWKRSSPSRGIFIHYGTDEVLKSDIEKFVGGLQKAGILIEAKAEPGGIHAWPVASLFLCSSRHDRLEGLVTMTREISQRMPSA